jgi:hypothetical protein
VWLHCSSRREVERAIGCNASSLAPVLLEGGGPQRWAGRCAEQKNPFVLPGMANGEERKAFCSDHFKTPRAHSNIIANRNMSLRRWLSAVCRLAVHYIVTEV